jgi:hypothetical protein
VTQTGISRDLQDFILQHINSVQRLEVLLLLYQNPRAWTAAAVSAVLYIAPHSAARNLQSLVSSGVASVTATADPDYRYAPKTEQLNHIVRELATAYQEHPVTVLTLIYSSSRFPLSTAAETCKLKRDQ